MGTLDDRPLDAPERVVKQKGIPVKQVRLSFLGVLGLAALLALALGSGAPAIHRADQGLAQAEHELTAQTSDLELTKKAQPVVRPGGEITYTLTITNTGAQAATNLIVRDVLPDHTTYARGGTLSGDHVDWSIADLPGYGGVEEKTLVVTADGEAGATILNDDYSAWAYSGQSVDGALTATTRIVDDWAWLTPWETYTLTYGSADVTTAITFPIGSVAEPVTVAYEELDQTLHPLATRTRSARRSFRLTGFQSSRLAPDIRTTDSFSVVLTFSTTLSSLSATAAEEPLQLYRWENGHWTKHGISCLAEPGIDRVACNVAPQKLGEFVLTETRHDVYLPVALRPSRYP
jgi:uncharacterized repeat protein (TIGR01451 family)